MAKQQCAWDDSHGWHNWVKTKGWSNTCTKHGSGQCECSANTPSWDACIKMYYDEGPGGGHYDIMMTDNFCGEGGSPGPSPPSPPSPAPQPSPPSSPPSPPTLPSPPAPPSPPTP